MRKIVFLCWLMSTMLCAASNVVSRTAVYCRNLDNRSDYGLDKTAECRRTTNKLVARMYAAGAANKTGVAKRVAIIKQGSHPAPENLQYLYAFTNDVSYACLAAASIVQIVGVTSNSIEVADHALSLDSVPEEDGHRLCEIIVQKANEVTTPLDCKRLAVDALGKYATRVSGAEALAKHIRMEQLGLPSNVAVKPISNEAKVSCDERIKAAFLSASAPRYCGTETSGAFQRAVDLCGGDARMISRIATEIAIEQTNRVSWAIGVLSKYGAREDVPFLLGFTNDVRHCGNAAHSLLCIEGVTEETIRIANQAIVRSADDSDEKYAICAAIARFAGSEDATIESRRLAISSLKRYSRTIPVTALWADGFLLSLDPDYETSDDRKALLREVAERRVNDYQIDYATNALKRIDAKIQSERKGD